MDKSLFEPVVKVIQRDADVGGFQLQCNTRCTTKAGKPAAVSLIIAGM